MTKIRAFLALTLFASLTACGATDGSEWEETDTESEPLGEGTCLSPLSAPSDAVLVAREWSTPPTTYDNPGCRKSFVFSSSTIGASGATVWWTDKHERTPVQCDGGSLTVQLMSRSNTFPAPFFYRNEGTFSAPLIHGRVGVLSEDTCWFPNFSVWDRGGVTYVTMSYAKAQYAIDKGPGPEDIRFTLPSSLVGRSVRLAAQALTPRGSTQSVSSVYY